MFIDHVKFITDWLFERFMAFDTIELRNNTAFVSLMAPQSSFVFVLMTTPCTNI